MGVAKKLLATQKADASPTGSNLSVINSISFSSLSNYDMKIRDNYLFIANGTNIIVFDISTAETPVYHCTYAAGGYCVDFIGDFMVAGGNEIIRVVDISDIANQSGTNFGYYNSVIISGAGICYALKPVGNKVYAHFSADNKIRETSDATVTWPSFSITKTQTLSGGFTDTAKAIYEENGVLFTLGGDFSAIGTDLSTLYDSVNSVGYGIGKPHIDESDIAFITTQTQVKALNKSNVNDLLVTSTLSIQTGGGTMSSCVRVGNILVVASGNGNSIFTVDVSDVNNMSIIDGIYGDTTNFTNAYSVAVLGNIAYVGSQNKLVVVDIS